MADRKYAPSKLDEHTELLVAWLTPKPDGEGLTYVQVLAKLEEAGVHCSIGNLSGWWSKRRADLREEKSLKLFAEVSRNVKRFRDGLKDNPPPALEDLANRHAFVVWKLAESIEDEDDRASAIAQFSQAAKNLVEFARTQDKRTEVELALAKFKDAVEQRKKAIADELKTASETGGLRPETRERIERELNLL